MLYEPIIFLLGLATGSFLNVVICRLETGEGIVKSRSHCPKCGHILIWRDLVPIFNFIWLKGKCRYCQEPISWQYPIVEIATASLFLLISNFQFPISKEFPIFNFQKLVFILYCLILICSFIIIFVYDLKHYLIPDKIIYPAIGIALFYRIIRIVEAFDFSLASLGFRSGNNLYPELVEGFYCLLSALAAAAFFLSLVFVTKGKGMGLGDVKLAFFIGLVLGWPQILLALFLAFLSGALVGLGFIAFGAKTLKSQIPFGPFLAASTVFVMMLGERILNFFAF